MVGLWCKQLVKWSELRTNQTERCANLVSECEAIEEGVQTHNTCGNSDVSGEGVTSDLVCFVFSSIRNISSVNIKQNCFMI